MKFNSFEKGLTWLVVCFMLGFTILVYDLFFSAFFSGSMQVVVHIDRFGEAYVELVVLLLVGFLIMYEAGILFKKIWRK